MNSFHNIKPMAGPPNRGGGGAPSGGGRPPRGGGMPGGDDHRGPIRRFFGWYLTRCGKTAELLTQVFVRNHDGDLFSGMGAVYRFMFKWMLALGKPLVLLGLVFGLLSRDFSSPWSFGDAAFLFFSVVFILA